MKRKWGGVYRSNIGVVWRKRKGRCGTAGYSVRHFIAQLQENCAFLKKRNQLKAGMKSTTQKAGNGWVAPFKALRRDRTEGICRRVALGRKKCLVFLNWEGWMNRSRELGTKANGLIVHIPLTAVRVSAEWVRSEGVLGLWEHLYQSSLYSSEYRFGCCNKATQIQDWNVFLCHERSWVCRGLASQGCGKPSYCSALWLCPIRGLHSLR